MSSPLFLLLVALGLGVALGIWLARIAAAQATATLRAHAAKSEAEHVAAVAEREKLRAEAGELRVREARYAAELSGARERQGELEAAALQAEAKHEALHGELRAAGERLARAEAELAAERAAGSEKLALLTGARVELTDSFKTLASEILEEKSKRFTDHNRVNIDQLLMPLREKLGEFQLKVEALKEDGIAGRSELKTHIDGLRSLNERLSAEASSLVAALKGSSKTQGDWGEMLLERMLEECGLRRGHEYRVQESFTREDGTRARPDVIVDLPEGKHLVIDAKVSLVDYNAYCACNDEAGRAASLAKHVSSLRQHLRGLSKRDYQALYQLQSIDFVVMFVPIEPAYLLALARDGSLWRDAWERDVLLVSPGSLYPVVRTVAHLWRQTQQNRNVEEIGRRGTLLYEKLVAFVTDLQKVGAGLGTAQEAYDKALAKLKSGNGNLIWQAAELKKLGVKSTKQMPRLPETEGVDAQGEQGLLEDLQAADASVVVGGEQESGLDQRLPS